MRMWAAVVVLLASAQAPAVSLAEGPKPAAPPAPAAQDWVSEADSLWEKRDEPAAAKALNALLRERLARDPDSFDANLRQAMVQCWAADGLAEGAEDLKAALGKSCWEFADKAIAARPGDVRPHYWGAVGLGLYAEGVGILNALAQGLEGKFRARLAEATRLDPNFLDGSSTTVLGRYYWKLPWPKRDVEKSLQILGDAARAWPENLLTRLYLADALESAGRKEEARAQARVVVAARGKDPQDRRVMERARRWLSSH